MVKEFCHVVDTLNNWVGRIVGWLIVPLTFIVAYDVFLRYVFNRPTIWAWDISSQLLGIFTVLGGGYTLLYGGHIGVDILVVKLSPRKRAVIDLITSLLFFFGFGLLVWQTASEAWDSLKIAERQVTYFAAPIYPFKMIMALGILLLFLQGTVRFLRDFITILSPTKKESNQ